MMHSKFYKFHSLSKGWRFILLKTESVQALQPRTVHSSRDGSYSPSPFGGFVICVVLLAVCTAAVIMHFERDRGHGEIVDWRFEERNLFQLSPSHVLKGKKVKYPTHSLFPSASESEQNPRRGVSWGPVWR